MVREKVSEHEKLLTDSLKLVYQGKELTKNSSAISDLELDPKISIFVVGKKAPKTKPPKETPTPKTQVQQPPQQQQPQQPPTPILSKEETALLKIDEILHKAEQTEIQLTNLKERQVGMGEKKYTLEKKKCDEFLTRCLLDLDGVDVNGNEDLRAKRRNVIKHIQTVQSFIESSL